MDYCTHLKTKPIIQRIKRHAQLRLGGEDLREALASFVGRMPSLSGMAGGGLIVTFSACLSRMGMVM